MNDNKETYNQSPPNYGPGPGPQPQPGGGYQYPQSVQPPPMGTPQKSAAQIGEEYRSALYAQCAAGNHQRTRKFGMCGIITAVACFPCGLICLFTDSEQKCSQCGIRLDK